MENLMTKSDVKCENRNRGGNQVYNNEILRVFQGSKTLLTAYTFSSIAFDEKVLKQKRKKVKLDAIMQESGRPF